MSDLITLTGCLSKEPGALSQKTNTVTTIPQTLRNLQAVLEVNQESSAQITLAGGASAVHLNLPNFTGGLFLYIESTDPVSLAPKACTLAIGASINTPIPINNLLVLFTSSLSDLYLSNPDSANPVSVFVYFAGP